MTIAELYINNDAVGLAALVKERRISARELVEAAIRCIESLNPSLARFQSQLKPKKSRGRSPVPH
jgi:Asp-tRNA(Asn)/Glu-tRNA(Gln) amidotransferase A subunit family amidase